MADFSAQVFQNEYLPAGADTVDAVITVKAHETVAQPNNTQMTEIIVIDTSGSMMEGRGQKMAAARTATKAAIDTLPDGIDFAVVSGTEVARAIYPPRGLAVSNPQSRDEAKRAVDRVPADGGTAIGSWLRAARYLFGQRPNSISHCILLTDGKNQHEESFVLDAAINECIGQFQCDCRGLGTDWNVDELRRISSALLGTVDIIPRPEDMEEEFRALTQAAMEKQVGSVALRLWSPKGASVEFLRQVAPTLDDLTLKADTVSPLIKDYPLGAWADDESRDYHLRVRIPAGNVGDERLGARVMLAIDDTEQPVALVRAVWTNDDNLSTRINREVAHYTGQAELAGAIADGLTAQKSGDDATATMKLGQAVKLAYEAGNHDTVRLLQQVVDVEDPATGTIRLKRQVEVSDAMALDVRSTRTVRINK